MRLKRFKMRFFTFGIILNSWQNDKGRIKGRIITDFVQLIDLHALNIGEGITSGNTTATFVSFLFALSGFCLQNEQSQVKTKNKRLGEKQKDLEDVVTRQRNECKTKF